MAYQCAGVAVLNENYQTLLLPLLLHAIQKDMRSGNRKRYAHHFHCQANKQRWNEKDKPIVRVNSRSYNSWRLKPRHGM